MANVFIWTKNKLRSETAGNKLKAIHVFHLTGNKKMKINLISPREKEVVALLAIGLSYQSIADKLDISHETVKMHIKNIYRKLNVQNKIEALRKVKLL